MGERITPISVIAEIGVNWEGPSHIDCSQHSLDNAQAMIIYAKESGANAVKFQLFNKENIAESPLKERLSKLILTEDRVAELAETAHHSHIDFILTPMYLEAVGIAAKYADVIKIRYKDHENEKLIQAAEDTGLPLLISVPRLPLSSLRNMYCPNRFYLFCLPRYPPEIEDFTLEFATPCRGVSLHYPHTICDLAWAINRTFADGFIEKHVMLNPPDYSGIKMDGQPLQAPPASPIDAAVSITFGELAEFTKQLKIVDRIQRVRL